MAFICKDENLSATLYFYIEQECNRELWDLNLRTRVYFQHLPSILKGDSLGKLGEMAVTLPSL